MKQSKKLCRLALLVVATMLLALAGCRNASGGGEDTVIYGGGDIGKVTVLNSASLEEAITAIKNVKPGDTLKIELAECSSIEGLSQAVRNVRGGGISIELDLSKTKITSIGGFDYAGFLTEVILPETLTIIEENAFNTPSLKTINIPASVTSIGENAFSYYGDLAAINVAEGNTKYFSDNGVLYNSEKQSSSCAHPKKQVPS